MAANAEGRLERFQEMVLRTGPAASLEEAARAIAEESCAAVGADRAIVWVLAPGAQELVTVGVHGVEPGAISGFERFPLAAGVPVADAVRSGEPYWIESLADYAARWPHIAAEHPRQLAHVSGSPRAWAVLPLVVRGRAVGGMVLGFPEARGFPEDERRYLLAVAAHCAQVVDRSRALQELADRTEFYRTLTEEMRDLVSLTDLQGRIVYASPSYREVLGHDPAGLAGASTLDLIHPDDRRDAIESGRRQLAESGTVTHRLRYRHADGSYRALEGRGVLVTLRGERLILGVGRDVTARAEMEARLLEAHSELKQAIAQRSVALGLIAHELRNPITPMLLRIASLRGRVDPETSANLDVLERSVLRIEDLVCQILDLARSSAGTFQVQRQPCDLAQLAHEALEALRPAADRERIRLRMSAPATLPLLGDRARLFQVIGNLVGNAVKFNRPGGEVDITLGVRDGSATLRVADTGQGFEPDQAGLLFQPFSRLDDRRPGVGLGLYLCHVIVGLHGGTLAARSDGPGLGATFEATIPLAPGPEPSARGGTLK